MIAAILQARMRSVRLPGKIMKKVAGKPLLEHQILRMQRARTIDSIILATTRTRADNPTARLGKKLGIMVYRGSEDDVLDRYYQAAKKFSVHDIVRITGDCPLIDPAVIDLVVGFYIKNKEKFPYVANVTPPTFPDGMDVEVFSFESLEGAWKHAALPSEREHVVPYITEHCSVGNVRARKDRSHIRITVDEPRDLVFVRKIFKGLYTKKRHFTLKDIIAFLDSHPEFQKINKGIERNEGYQKSLASDKARAAKLRGNRASATI